MRHERIIHKKRKIIKTELGSQWLVEKLALLCCTKSKFKDKFATCNMIYYQTVFWNKLKCQFIKVHLYIMYHYCVL